MKLYKYAALVESLIECYNSFPDMDNEDRNALSDLIKWFYRKMSNIVTNSICDINYCLRYSPEKLVVNNLLPERPQQYEGKDWMTIINCGIPKPEHRELEDAIHKMARETECAKPKCHETD